MDLDHESEAGEDLDQEAVSRALAAHAASAADERAADERAAQLVERFQAGDVEAFGELYKMYFERVFVYLRVILRRIHEAEDLAQQTFLRAFEALPDYELRGRPLRNWLFTIARNLAMDHLKRIQRVELMDPAALDRLREGSNGEDELLDALGWITDSDLMIFVERLSLPQRQVLVLRFLLDQTDAQIAKVLKRSPSDVRMLQSRALSFLRERLIQIGKGPKGEDEEQEKKEPPKETKRAPMRRAPRHATVARARRWALWD